MICVVSQGVPMVVRTLENAPPNFKELYRTKRKKKGFDSRRNNCMHRSVLLLRGPLMDSSKRGQIVHAKICVYCQVGL